MDEEEAVDGTESDAEESQEDKDWAAANVNPVGSETVDGEEEEVE